MLNTGIWKRLALALALIKVGAGVVAFAFTDLPKPDPAYPYVFHMIFALPFTAAGILLVTGGRRDSRAVSLGGFFLMAATAFVNRPLRTYVGAHLPAALLMKGIDATELDAFMAFFLWCFVRDFPHPVVSPVWTNRINKAVIASLVGGAILFVLNLINFGFEAVTGKEGPLADLIPMRGKGAYYSVLLTLTAAAFVFLFWRIRSLTGTDQRRVRLFLQSFIFPAVPLSEILFGLFFPPYMTYKTLHPALDHGVILFHMVCVLMMPLLTSYAVLVHQVLDVKLLARRALQYALARYSAIALAALPSLALLAYLWEHSEESIKVIFSGYRLPVLLSLTFIGFAALSYRRSLLDAIDRRFFREQYDARRILTQLLARVRGTSGIASLASLITHEVDLALHLEGVSLLVIDPRSGVLVDPHKRNRRLDVSSQLALLASDVTDPLTIDLADGRSPLARLPEAERHWLVDNGFRLIVPILARDGSLIGLLGLGEKRSGLPFLKEDRELLRAIASSASFVIELDQTHSNTPAHKPTRRLPAILEVEDDDTVPEPVSYNGELAKECPKCNRLYPSYTVLCNVCSTRLEPSHVPYVLPGKFRFEKRIGTGGMGVVYRASDLSLGRAVAVKTLRRVSPEDAMRLRREARTAAAVSHPHLAPVYGMETWQGTPMLVLELLEGGTLAHRLLDRGRLTPRETVDLGIAMTEALAQLHAADILHRDIKPSNIGFTRDNTPKLMDFGIARLMYDLRREREEGDVDRSGEEPSLPGSSVWTPIDGITPRSKPLVGTLSYLCPEALEGKPPDALFDLWSLAIVLYECLLGRKVFSSTDPRQTAARIRLGRVPDLLQLAPEYDENLADLFRTALHKSRGRRPASAGELKQKLESVRGRL